MTLPFLDHEPESKRLRRLIRRQEGSFGVLYGRRRCGKSRPAMAARDGQRDLSVGPFRVGVDLNAKTRFDLG